MATETKKKTTTKTPRAKKEKEAIESTEAGVIDQTAMAATVMGGSYIFGLGRRKTSIARVRLIKNGKGMMSVNGKPMDKYFTTYELREIVASPLKTSGQETAVDVSASVEGGGIRGQAEAVRLGISRSLIIMNPAFRKTLKKLGFLTRDPRAKERKKPGLKKARRSPQWSKR